MFTAAPYWLDKPTNLVLAPEENGRLVCRANGNPKPNIQWLINGQPIDSMENSVLFSSFVCLFLSFFLAYKTNHRFTNLIIILSNLSMTVMNVPLLEYYILSCEIM